MEKDPLHISNDSVNEVNEAMSALSLALDKAFGGRVEVLTICHVAHEGEQDGLGCRGAIIGNASGVDVERLLRFGILIASAEGETAHQKTKH